MKNNKMTSWVWQASCVLLILALAGCGSTDKKDVYDKQYSENLKRTSTAMGVLQQDQPKPQFAAENQRMIVSSRSIALGRDAALPEKIRSVTFRSGDRLSLSAIAERLSRELQIQVVVSPELRTDGSGGGVGSGFPVGAAAPARLSAAPVSTAGGAEEGGGKFLLDYAGSLSGLLDYISSLAQVQWKYEGGRIVFYKTQTLTYVVKAFAGEFKITTSLGGGGGAGGGIAGTVDSPTEFWVGFEAGLKTLVSSGAKIAIDRNAGLIVLTDTFSAHEQVEQYLAQVNAQLMRQISLDVEIITVDLNQDGSQGIDWSWVNSTLRASGQADTFSFASPPAPATTAGGNTPFTVKLNPISGRAAMFQLLQVFGKVSNTYSGIVVTTNRTAAPVAVNNTVAYLASTTPGVSTTGGTTSPGLTPGQVTTGTNVTMLPLILDSNQVLLQAVVRLSSLNSMVRFDSGQGANQQSIQLPNVGSFTLAQRLVVPTGQTMVMMGYDRVNSTTNTTGATEDITTSKSTTGQKQTIVVLITPRLLDVQSQ